MAEEGSERQADILDQLEEMLKNEEAQEIEAATAAA